MKKTGERQVSTKPAKSRVPLEAYTDISRDVWKLFKDKYTNEISWAKFWDGVHELNEEYEGCIAYEFMQKLLKLYFDELKEV